MNAMNCTVKLIGYRKSRTDGMVVSFSIHPNEVPDKLQTDPIGTSYMMALVEVDDATGQPKGGDTDQPALGHPDNTAPRPSPPAGGAHKSWDELSPAQQAGILCNEPPFYSFIFNNYGFTGAVRDSAEAAPTLSESAAIIVRYLCGIRSRTQLDTNARAKETWGDIVGDYRAWQREPEVVG